MPSLLPGYEYDVFISYRQKDNKYDRWVTEFVGNLRKELEATFKDDVSLYFDENPHDGLLETHLVNKSLEVKLKCIIFIPILSQTYCDTKSYAWQHEFLAFHELASSDSTGLNVHLRNGNTASRILPVRIHELDQEDLHLMESTLGGPLRAIDFIYREPGVNRPLRPDDAEGTNQNKTRYRNQVNKVANAIKEIILAMKDPLPASNPRRDNAYPDKENRIPVGKSRVVRNAVMVVLLSLVTALAYWYFKKAAVPEAEKSVAVLPFVSLSGQTDQQYIADGLSEEIINALAQASELKVIARSSSFQFSGRNEDPRNVGEKLGVAHLIEGSVQLSPEKVRVIARLVDTRDGYQRWSKTFESEPSNMMQVMQEIASQVARQLRISLDPTDEAATWNTEALKAYQQARFIFDRNGAGDRLKSMAFFEEALAHDSSKAIVYAYLGAIYSESDIPKARKLLAKAMQLDSTLAEPYIVSARLEKFLQNHRKAYALVQKALKYGSNKPQVLRISGRQICELGNPEEGLALIRKAITLDPLAAISYSQLAQMCLVTGAYAELESVLIKALELSPDLNYGHAMMAQALMFRGRIKEAAVENNMEKDTIFKWINQVYLFDLQGKKRQADSLYYKYAEEYGRTASSDVATVAAQIHLIDESFKWFNISLSQINGGPEYLLIDVKLEPIRKDPRYQELVKKMDFPEVP